MPTATDRSPSDLSHFDSLAGLAAHHVSMDDLRTAIQSAPIGIAQFDGATHTITMMNHAFMRMCGLMPGDVSEDGVPWETLLPPACVERWESVLAELSQEGHSTPFETEIRCRDGPPRWALVAATRLNRNEGVAFLVDITDRKLAERALRDSEMKLRRISDSGVIGVFYCTGHREIVEANDKFLQMLGYTREDMKAGRLNGDRLTPARWAALDELKMAEADATGSASAWEKELYASDGRTVPVMVAMARLEPEDETCVVICLDITNRRAAEAERERLLGREHAERQRAERAIRLRDEVLAVVAHDLRNPLNTIQLSAGAMADQGLSSQVRSKQLSIIERVVADMNQLIGNLLDVARLENGSFPINRTIVDVRELLDRATSGFELQLQERDIVLALEDRCDRTIVSCDPVQIGRVLSNLLVNAMKFTPAHGRVTLRSESLADSLVLSVEDTGQGISETDLPHIFDRFWKADSAYDQGVGLGLAIAKGIIDSHGGRIWAESQPGRGSTFSFTIPF